MQFLLELFTFLGVLIFYAQCDTRKFDLISSHFSPIQQANSDSYNWPRNWLTAEKTTVSVATLLDKPYTMLRDGYTTLTGNERYEGFLVDLIDEIARKIGKSENDDFRAVRIIWQLCNY